MKESATVQFKLLLPAALKARVEGIAKENRRSLSQEIVALLEAALEPSQTVATLNINMDLADLDKEEMKEKLVILEHHIKKMKVKVLPPMFNVED